MRAKFLVSQIKRIGDRLGDGNLREEQVIELKPYGDQAADCDLWNGTLFGKIELGTIAPGLADKFELGKDYHVDFRLVDDTRDETEAAQTHDWIVKDLVCINPDAEVANQEFDVVVKCAATGETGRILDATNSELLALAHADELPIECRWTDNSRVHIQVA